MIKNFFNRLTGKPEGEKTEKKPATQDNAVEKEEKLLKAICDSLKPYFGAKEIIGKFEVWVANSQHVLQNYVHTESFQTELCAALQNKGLIAVSNAKFEFKTENPPAELDLQEITEGVFIQYVAPKKEEEQITKVFTKAKISIADNKGSLAENKYLLDAETQTTFNIGRGEENNNHIIIVDKTNSVSSTHAKIVFIGGNGFCLQSLNPKRRTILFRKKERYADTDEGQLYNEPMLLQDNDEIELAKSVLLKFEIVKNENNS